MIILTLPYPISANRYWATRVVAAPGKRPMAMTYVTAEAKDFKEQVGWLAKAAGIRTPLLGRIELGVQLYPNRPQDWARRERREGATWDDSVMCLDLDNANKVLLDSIKGIVIEDDKWVRKITSERMVPDEKGARVVLYVRQVAAVQADLLEAAA